MGVAKKEHLCVPGPYVWNALIMKAFALHLLVARQSGKFTRMVTNTLTTKEAKMVAWEANFGSTVPSPMAPFQKGLRVLKYLGLPLEFNNEEATECKEKGRLWKCILLPVGE